MSKTNWFLGIVAVAAILVAGYLFTQNRKQKTVIKDLSEEREHLKLLLSIIRRSNQFDDNLKSEIEKLIKKFNKIDASVANELAQALQLLQIGQIENAIEDLVKIMEHLLSKKYSTDSSFLKWIKENKRKKDLHNYLEFSKITGLITDVEFSFFNAVRVIRNKEDHEVDFKLDKYLTASGLVTAIGGIMKIGSIVYPNPMINK
jgi:hypothetical protein